jgi:hypothetical protein
LCCEILAMQDHECNDFGVERYGPIQSLKTYSESQHFVFVRKMTQMTPKIKILGWLNCFEQAFLCSNFGRRFEIFSVQN